MCFSVVALDDLCKEVVDVSLFVLGVDLCSEVVGFSAVVVVLLWVVVLGFSVDLWVMGTGLSVVVSFLVVVVSFLEEVLDFSVTVDL